MEECISELVAAKLPTSSSVFEKLGCSLPKEIKIEKENKGGSAPRI